MRVKSGVRIPDGPDIPLGGGAGTTQEVEQETGQAMFLVAWERAAPRGMHPIYKKQ